MMRYISPALIDTMKKEKVSLFGKWRLGSGFGCRAIAVLMILCGLALITALPMDQPTDDEQIESFVSDAVNRWRTKYGNAADLQVAFIDINFHKEPKFFTEGEGVVISPVGIDLYGAQKILEVESYPPFLRKLTVEGITNLSWEYSGKINRDLRYVALTLVKRSERAKPTIPDWPTHDSLPPDLCEDALATARDLEEHGLHECAEFPSWVQKVAGEPPYTEQFLRIVRTIGANIVEKDPGKYREDICGAMRKGRFTIHRGHVLAVMAARQLGIPAFGFASASPRKIYLVGIYTDQAGWLLVDIENYEEGYFTGGPVLLTKTPIISPFEGSMHEFWLPQAAAYSGAPWGGVWTFSRTKWLGRQPPSELPTDTTEAKSFPLSEIYK